MFGHELLSTVLVTPAGEDGDMDEVEFFIVRLAEEEECEGNDHPLQDGAVVTVDELGAYVCMAHFAEELITISGVDD